MLASLVLAGTVMLTPAQGYGYGCGYGSSYGYSNYYNGYGYSSSYAPGYTWYKAGYYDGRYYPAGYYSTYYPDYSYKSSYYKPVYVYQPVAFSTYQPAAIVSRPLAAVEQLTALQATGYGVAAVPAVPTVNVGTVATVGLNAAGVAAVPSKCDKLAEALLAINTRLSRLEGGGAASIPPPPKERAPAPKGGAQAAPPDVSALVAKGKMVFTDRCASCHGASSAKHGTDKQGREWKFFDGKEPLDLPLETWAFAQADIMTGKMPMGGQLTQEEGQNLSAYIVDKINQKRQAMAAQKGKQ